MCYLFFKYKFHEFLCRRAHTCKALPHSHYFKPHAFKVLHHLCRTPSVECYITDIETLPEALNKLLNKTVVDNIPFGSLYVSLLCPQVIIDMIPFHSKVECLFRHPEVWKDDVFIILILGRKAKAETCQVCCRR